MSRNFKALTITHKNAPLRIREKVALNENECNMLLHRFQEYTDAKDVLILSTCNRSEIYFSSENTSLSDALKFLSMEKGINNIDEIDEYITYIEDKDQAIHHLYRVSIGLESSVVGDMQILNQVKKAYQLSANKELAGPFLHRLMHSIFYTNKRIVHETPFRDGSASISYLAADLGADLIRKVKDPRILVLGTGEMGSDVCRNLKEMDVANVRVMNRTIETAKEIAAECNFEYISFDELSSAVKEADLVISSINNESPIINLEVLEGYDISHKIFIDISVPRSVSTDVDQINGVIVYNVDELNSKASEALTKRTNSIPSVESIIKENINEFEVWRKEMLVSPTINKLKSALEDIRKKEIARHLKNLSTEEAETLDMVTKNIMQKIIKLPALELKAACKRGEADTLIDVLNDLFDLEKQKDNSPKS